MDFVRASLFVATVAALILQITWLFWALAILLFCILLLDYGQPRQARLPRGAAKGGEPVIIQSSADATAYNFVGELVSTIVTNTLSDNSAQKRLDAHHKAVSGKVDALSAKVDKLAEKPKK